MSEERYEARVRVTWESCRAQVGVRLSHTVRELWVLALLSALGAAILMVIRSPMAMWVAIPAAGLTAVALCAKRVLAARLYALRHHRVDELKITFDGQGVRILSAVEDSRIAYDDITGMARDERYIMLRLRHHVPLVMGLDEVQDGQADALAAFLERRTGRTIRPLKS